MKMVIKAMKIFKLAEVIIKIYTMLFMLTIFSFLLVWIFYENGFEFPLYIMFKIFSPDILGGKRGGIIEFTATVVMFYKVYTIKNSDNIKEYNKTVILCVLGLVESLIIFFGLPLY